MAFRYHKGELSIVHGDKIKKLSSLVERESEPFYVYDILGMSERLDLFKSSLSKIKKLSIHYAFKANAHPEVLKNFASQGIGVDVVSGGELERALEAGFPASEIVFSGVGKTKKEIILAIKKEIKQINVECPAELERIGQLATKMNKTVKIAFRMNPDVNPQTHPYIRTGFRDNKFGMDQSFFPELRTILRKYSQQIHFTGLSMHIGSQIKEVEPFLEAIQKTLLLYNSLKREGWPLESLDIGGGLGMSYEQFDDVKGDEQRIKEYGSKISELLIDFNGEILCEPGRILVARFGVLLGEVQYIKKTPYKNFVILNTGMHHLLRPSLYQAFHNIYPLKEEVCDQLYDIVGPICESSDVLGSDRSLPKIKEGDWLCILDAGAYGRTMASEYNFHAFPGEKVVRVEDLS